ncbi:hypothetical protein QTO34_019292 [Cnephaeus nilssonii]|uniref:Connexin N-terminal domain-containing protein n=1 Tax=Cnephaeus nilssonii TaxID=3371016 RepID=A0AA40LNX1_CNENI|nr:hypothetical protein QTO34_019292 [Eptesicus nilssonii]
MDRLDLLGFLIITLNCNVTIVGKIWLIFMILLRMVVIIVAGSPVYQDEQERFVCNTLQPGCANVCYDVFSPVSHCASGWSKACLSSSLPRFSVSTCCTKALSSPPADPGGQRAVQGARTSQT